MHATANYHFAILVVLCK